MLKVAITGGVASGKSTVSEYLLKMGYKVYDADKIYADLLNDPVIVEKISKLVGVQSITENDKSMLDKKAISKKVFNDKPLLKKFNEYTHALVYQKIDDIIKRSTDEILFFEIPLLFESGKENEFDKVIVIKRDVNDRITSAKIRDGSNDEAVTLKIKNQIDYDNYDFSKHTVIYNDGDVKSLYKSVIDAIDSWKK